MTPDYWKKAVRELGRGDPILAAIMRRHRGSALVSRGDPFATLARSVVGQQISVKAADSVWARLQTLIPELAPAAVLAFDVAALRSCGLSLRKAEYLRDLATHFADGAIHVDRWAAMDDASIIAELTAVRGIGVWTAEMFLIFHLMRPNVLPLDDLGLIKGISQSYFSGEPVSRAEARDVAEAWSPYRTVGTWYLWRSLDPLPVAY